MNAIPIIFEKAYPRSIKAGKIKLAIGIKTMPIRKSVAHH